jgi:hypothetical protein
VMRLSRGRLYEIGLISHSYWTELHFAKRCPIGTTHKHKQNEQSFIHHPSLPPVKPSTHSYAA